MLRGRITLVYLLGLMVIGGCHSDANQSLIENLERSTAIVKENSQSLHYYLMHAGAEKMRAQPIARLSNAISYREILFDQSWSKATSKNHLLLIYQEYEHYMDSVCREMDCQIELVEDSELEGLDDYELKQVLRYRAYELSYTLRDQLIRYVDVGVISCGFSSLHGIDSLSVKGNSAAVYITTMAANLGENNWTVVPREIKRNGKPFECYPIKGIRNPQNVFQFSELPPGDYEVAFHIGNIQHLRNLDLRNEGVHNLYITTFTIPKKD
ncbi:hypothetical protein [Phaeocystidibacter luteus]|uniref:Uncharacterized protein n=1 Tax=Phaeocystidibacter luteus TaxID=911197 RepID=A0A6N6RIV5_9FLAO|nr:hypothetical protein [Phaeocystidibacter luteus]KAB2814232.1 hypothetical protein F8C67_00450 [Phaeocystidibacter luteus]